MKIIIILLIGAGMWLLQYLFRDDEEEQRQQRRQKRANRPGPRPERQRSRSQSSSGAGSSDLDRFLQEARRRRQSTNQQEPVVEAELVRETPPPLRPPQPQPKPKSPPRSQPVQGPSPLPAPRPRPPEPLVEVRQLREYASEGDIPIQDVPENVEAIEMDVNLTSRSQRRKLLTFMSMKEVEKILEANGFAPAVVLSEVLKPPLSQRQGGYRS